MELYLDSANLKEIEEVSKWGLINGLTTTPTFMQREGIKDIDGTIKKLSKIVPVLQIEALGNNADEVLKEAKRLIKLGLDPKKTVFKIPVSLEGVRACRLLVEKGFQVNVHLVYTLQQAYMAMHAGATYVCPLVGRLQDQGHDALSLVKQCVDTVNKYGYKTKIMFSSVRHAEHVRNAIDIGVHTITIPYKVLKSLTDNHLTDLGTKQFIKDTRLMTSTVGEIMRDAKPFVTENTTLGEALVKMTSGGFGAVAVLDKKSNLKGVFTDGDLRRLMQSKNNKDVLNKKMSEFSFKKPKTISIDTLLNDAFEIFKTMKVDSLVVVNKDKVYGMLDIQDLSV